MVFSRTEPVQGGRRRPSLGRVEPEDLANTERMFELFRRATRDGIVKGSEAELERFFAAAAHALRCAKSNPPGMFASIVLGVRYDLPNVDYDAALKRLRRYAYSGDESREEQARRERDIINEVWQ